MSETWITHHHVIEMITSETPYKLAEIIRDTWPNLYRNPKDKNNNFNNKINNFKTKGF